MVILKPPELFPEAHTSTNTALEKLDPQNPNVAVLKKTDNQELLAWTMNILEEYIYQTSAIFKTSISQNATPQFAEREMSKEELNTAVDTAANRALVGLANIQQVCFQGSAKFKPGTYIDTKLTPINILPTFGQNDNVDVVTDSTLKTIKVFRGDSGDCPEELQSWLRSIYDIQKTSNLSRNALIKVILRKSDGVARILVEDYLKSINDTAEDCLLKVILFLEQRYSLSWAPKICRAKLQSLQKTHTGTKNYSALQAMISRLANLASLDQTPETRESFLKANQLPIFHACLTKTDQSILIRCEDNRVNQNQPPLDLPSAVQELLVYHSVRNASNISDTPYTSESLEPNTGSSEIVHFLPQERGRQRFNSTPRREVDPSSERKGNPRQWTKREDKTGNQHRRQDSRNWQRNRSESRNRDDPDQRDRLKNGPGGPRVASREPSRNFRDSSKTQTGNKFLTCKDAGVPQGCCIRCASNQHKMSDPSCIYADTPLPNSGCRRCLKGGAHYSKYCKFPKDNNISSSSRGRTTLGAPPRFSQRGARFSQGRPSMARNHTSARKTYENQQSAEEEVGETFFFENQD